MNYKDERIKDALANVESKVEILDEAKKAYHEAMNKLAKITETVFIEKVAKPGEIIRSKAFNTPFYFDHIEAGIFGNVEVICHPQKKDGTPSLAIRKMPVSYFADL